jgi:hypothetical protein
MSTFEAAMGFVARSAARSVARTTSVNLFLSENGGENGGDFGFPLATVIPSTLVLQGAVTAPATRRHGPGCGKNFKRVDNRNRHVGLHTAVLLWCPVLGCKYTTTGEWNLRRHKDSHGPLLICTDAAADPPAGGAAAQVAAAILPPLLICIDDDDETIAGDDDDDDDVQYLGTFLVAPTIDLPPFTDFFPAFEPAPTAHATAPAVPVPGKYPIFGRRDGPEPIAPPRITLQQVE